MRKLKDCSMELTRSNCGGRVGGMRVQPDHGNYIVTCDYDVAWLELSNEPRTWTDPKAEIRVVFWKGWTHSLGNYNILHSTIY